MFDLEGELDKVEEMVAAAKNAESLEKETAAST